MLCVATLGACRAKAGMPPGSAAGETPTRADSLLGTVRFTGSSPFPTLVLRPANGAPEVTLSGADTAALRRATGLEVVVWGSTTGTAVDVSSFAVRAADGQPAVDGRVAREGDGLVLETGAGRVPLGNPPAALRELVGARVWIAGPLDTGPNPYGLLDPAPRR